MRAAAADPRTVPPGAGWPGSTGLVLASCAATHIPPTATRDAALSSATHLHVPSKRGGFVGAFLLLPLRCGFPYPNAYPFATMVASSSSSSDEDDSVFVPPGQANPVREAGWGSRARGATTTAHRHQRLLRRSWAFKGVGRPAHTRPRRAALSASPSCWGWRGKSSITRRSARARPGARILRHTPSQQQQQLHCGGGGAGVPAGAGRCWACADAPARHADIPLCFWCPFIRPGVASAAAAPAADRTDRTLTLVFSHWLPAGLSPPPLPLFPPGRG